jgi:hypothetical protein
MIIDPKGQKIWVSGVHDGQRHESAGRAEKHDVTLTGMNRRTLKKAKEWRTNDAVADGKQIHECDEQKDAGAREDVSSWKGWRNAEAKGGTRRGWTWDGDEDDGMGGWRRRKENQDGWTGGDGFIVLAERWEGRSVGRRHASSPSGSTEAGSFPSRLLSVNDRSMAA